MVPEPAAGGCPTILPVSEPRPRTEPAHDEPDETAGRADGSPGAPAPQAAGPAPLAPGVPATPEFAVVVPTLDEELRLPSCLDAVGPADGVEVVVSDGGSRDRTAEVAAARPGVRVVQGPPGRGRQLNRGAAASTAPLLLFVHADCRLPAGWQEALRDALGDPGTALVCFRLHTEPADPSGGRLVRWWLRLLDLRSQGAVLPYGDQGFALRREVFERLGGFPDIPLMEDLELARRCRRLGRIVRLELAMRTTGRRFQRRPVTTRLMTATFPTLYRLGVSPERLSRWYGHVR